MIDGDILDGGDFLGLEEFFELHINLYQCAVDIKTC